jgi:hypothetical protein
MKRLVLVALLTGCSKLFSPGSTDEAGVALDAARAPLPLVEVTIDSVTSPPEVRMEASDGGTHDVKSERNRFLLVKTKVTYHHCEDVAPRNHREGGAPAPPGKFALLTETQAVITLADGTKTVGDGWSEDPSKCVDCNDDPRLLSCDAGELSPQAVTFFFSMRKGHSLEGATFQFRDIELPLPVSGTATP